jgi:hypothetical protein
MAIAALAAILQRRSSRPDFWQLLEQLAIAAILTALSITVTTRGWSRPADYVAGSIIIQSVALAAAAIVLYRFRPTSSGRASAGVLGAAAIVHLVGILVPYSSGWTAHEWISAASFASLWSAVAYGALHAGSRWAFQGAIGLVAARVIILSFELSGDLLGSGVSLILSGMFAMAAAWATVRILKRFAPQKATAE